MRFVVPNDKLGLHDCPLVVIRCVDFRFRPSDQEFVERGLGIVDFDLYSWPGSAREVLLNSGFKESLIGKLIGVSVGLHHVQKLLLLWHWDCGGYGGSQAFKSPEEEEAAYRQDLYAVQGVLAAELTPDLEIMMAYSKPHPQGLEYVVID